MKNERNKLLVKNNRCLDFVDGMGVPRIINKSNNILKM